MSYYIQSCSEKLLLTYRKWILHYLCVDYNMEYKSAYRTVKKLQLTGATRIFVEKNNGAKILCFFEYYRESVINNILICPNTDIDDVIHNLLINLKIPEKNIILDNSNGLCNGLSFDLCPSHKFLFKKNIIYEYSEMEKNMFLIYDNSNLIHYDVDITLRIYLKYDLFRIINTKIKYIKMNISDTYEYFFHKIIFKNPIIIDDVLFSDELYLEFDIKNKFISRHLLNNFNIIENPMLSFGLYNFKIISSLQINDYHPNHHQYYKLLKCINNNLNRPFDVYPLPLDKFPNIIINKIFTHLNTSELLNFRLVNKKFKQRFEKCYPKLYININTPYDYNVKIPNLIKIFGQRSLCFNLDIKSLDSSMILTFDKSSLHINTIYIDKHQEHLLEFINNSQIKKYIANISIKNPTSNSLKILDTFINLNILKIIIDDPIIINDIHDFYIQSKLPKKLKLLHYKVDHNSLFDNILTISTNLEELFINNIKKETLILISQLKELKSLKVFLPLDDYKKDLYSNLNNLRCLHTNDIYPEHVTDLQKLEQLYLYPTIDDKCYKETLQSLKNIKYINFKTSTNDITLLSKLLPNTFIDNS